jgi:DNA modification methylase
VNASREPQETPLVQIRRLQSSVNSQALAPATTLELTHETAPSPQTNPLPQVTLSGIVERAPAELKPWAKNPRKHPPRQMTALAASMRVYGFTALVLIDEHDVILGGHARVQVAKDLGLPTIPVRVMSGMTEDMKRAYVIADNKMALLAEWDLDLLKGEMELLVQADFTVETTGFSTAETDRLLFEDTPSNPDDLQDQDIADVVTSRLGDLWLLGSHRLLCGNALLAADYQVVLDGALAQMCITDPPYNVAIDGHVCGSGKVKHKEFLMAAGEMSAAQFTAFLGTALTHIHAAGADGAINFFFMDWRHLPELQNAALPLFGPPRQLCVWVKDNAGMGTFYRSHHELVYVYKNGDAPHINNFELGQHGRYRTNVWSYPGVNSGNGRQLLALHPTVKPVSLIADAIRDCSHRKGVILDPFAGSGTILIAAERTGRVARAIELDPQYVDVAIKRWQRLTGKQAVLAATGQTWEAVRAERERAPALVMESDDDR